MTSAPEGHSCMEQSGPRNPASHLHPTCFSASQGVEYLMCGGSKRRFGAEERMEGSAAVVVVVVLTWSLISSKKIGS